MEEEADVLTGTILAFAEGLWKTQSPQVDFEPVL
jgi:hypothetical protein